MNDKSKRSRKRIFRGYPNNTLEQSILDAKDIIEQNLGMTIRKRALAKLWGISVNSSNYTSKINNMRGYGLTNAKKELADLHPGDNSINCSDFYENIVGEIHLAVLAAWHISSKEYISNTLI